MYYPIILPINNTDSYMVVPEIVKQFTVLSGCVMLLGVLMLIVELVMYFCFDKENDKIFRIGFFFSATGLGLLLMALVLICVTGEVIEP